MEEPSDTGLDIQSCPECRVDNPPDAKFCRQCGVSLRVRPQTSRGHESTEERAEKIRLRQEFNRIKKVVFFLRSTFATGALLFAVIFAGSLLEPGSSGRLEAIAAALGLGIMAAGAIRVKRQPLVWSVVIASLWSLWAGVLLIAHLLAGSFPPPMGLVQILLAVPFWAGVSQASRTQQLMREHAELSLDRRKVGATTKVSGGVTARALQKKREDRHRKAIRALKLLGIAVGVGVAAVVLFEVSTAPPTLSAQAERIKELWTSDIDGLVALVRDEAQRPRLAETIERRGWRTNRPQLDSGRIDDVNHAVVFKLPATAASHEGEFSAHFQLDPRANDWYLTFVELPGIRAGDPKLADEAFRAAWDSEGTDALIGLLARDMQRRKKSFETILQRRDWGEHRPHLRAADIRTPRDNGIVDIDYDTDDGLVETRWEYWHPQWRMTRFAPSSNR